MNSGMAGSPMSERVKSVCAGSIALVLASYACGDSSGPESCSTGDVRLVAESACLDFAQAGSVAAYRAVIQEEVERTLAVVGGYLRIDGIRIRIVADPSSVIPEVGLGGYAPSGSEIRIYASPDSSDLEHIIRSELLPILAHELHHVMRWRTVGYGATLFAAAVSEGLADHFAEQVAEIAPRPWSVALEDQELEFWMAEVLSAAGGYNHSDWFLGGHASIPRWTGYAVGYELVRQYLALNPGETAVSLVGEPAASFRP